MYWKCKPDATAQVDGGSITEAVGTLKGDGTLALFIGVDWLMDTHFIFDASRKPGVNGGEVRFRMEALNRMAYHIFRFMNALG